MAKSRPSLFDFRHGHPKPVQQEDHDLRVGGTIDAQNLFVRLRLYGDLGAEVIAQCASKRFRVAVPLYFVGAQGCHSVRAAHSPGTMAW